jgi:vanillate O-demethylase ferredoxin subunit
MAMSGSSRGIDVWVKSISYEAEGIASFELRPCQGDLLPAFTAGAHVTVEMAGDLSRSYSLVNSQDDRHRYVIAVSRDRASRGGSLYMHESVKVGHELRVSVPRNNFPLVEAAQRSIFIAGGIGITPLWCMVQRLHAISADWELHYATRSRSSAAFLDAMSSLGSEAAQKIHFHFDDESDGRQLDINAVFEAAPDAHVYCCGPLPMLRAFEALSVTRPASTVHSEYFAAGESIAPGGFTVQLARAGHVIKVPADSSILEALLANGIDIPHSCKEGTCGTCEVRVLGGIPDHRDVILSEEERQSNSKMMICCSGCRTETLILDI